MVRRRFLAALALFAVVAFVALPVAATTTTGAGTTETTVAGTNETSETTAPTVTIEPAVPVETAPAANAAPDWTYRFFIPTLLVLAALVVIATVIQYFTRVVRNRYRTVR
jgi:hypothetical protein